MYPLSWPLFCSPLLLLSLSLLSLLLLSVTFLLLVFLVLSSHFVCIFSLIKTIWFLGSLSGVNQQRERQDTGQCQFICFMKYTSTNKGKITVINKSNKMMQEGEGYKQIPPSRCSFLTYEKICGILTFSKLEALFICELQLTKISAGWLQILRVVDHTSGRCQIEGDWPICNWYFFSPFICLFFCEESMRKTY